MLTYNELVTLIDALDLAIASNRRAQNSNRTNPQFMELYKKIGSDLQNLRAKLAAQKDNSQGQAPKPTTK